jgi:nitrile hydratase
MPEHFSVGDRVRVRLSDPSGHTRVPSYIRGRTGTVVATDGEHLLPDDVVAHVDAPRRQVVYAVRFLADDLFGSGHHSVTVDLWEAYLRPTSSAENP